MCSSDLEILYNGQSANTLFAQTRNGAKDAFGRSLSTPEKEMAVDIMYEVDNNLSAEEFKRAVADIIADRRKELKEDIQNFSAWASNKNTTNKTFWEERLDKAEANLAVLRNFTPESFTYNPPTPMPKPPEKVGVIMRTLQRATDDEYMLHDVSAETAQSKQVAEAMLKATATLTDKEFHTFERLYNKTARTGGDFYSALGGALESDEAASKLLRSYGVAGVKYADGSTRRKTGDKTYNYVDFFDKGEGTAIIPVATNPAGKNQDILFSRAASYASPEMERAGKALDPFVTKNKSVWERIKADTTGLAFETKLVDRFAGFERLKKYMPELQGTQMMYYLRMYDQRMNFVAQSVGTGALSVVDKKRADGKVERVLEAKEGPSIKSVVEILKDANPMVGNAEAVNRLFTGYMAAIRAKNKGFESLNFGEDVTQDMLDDALRVVENNPKIGRAHV